MTLVEKVEEDCRNALREGHKLELSTLRMLLAELKNARIAKREELTEEEELQVAAREARKRKEAIEGFTRGGRLDLVERETEELKVIEAYLPRQMDEEEVARVVAETIREVGASAPSDLGRVMSAVMPKVKGKADGKKVNRLVREALQK